MRVRGGTPSDNMTVPHNASLELLEKCSPEAVSAASYALPHMMRSPAAALAGALPCLCLMLGKAAVLQGFVTTAQSFIPAPSNVLLLQHFQSSSLQEHPHRQRTRVPESNDCNSSSGSRSSRRWPAARAEATRLSMASPSPGGGESSGGVSRAIAKGWIAAVLCVTSLFGSPDVLVGNTHGLPLASALSEEQVSDGSYCQATERMRAVAKPSASVSFPAANVCLTR